MGIVQTMKECGGCLATKHGSDCKTFYRTRHHQGRDTVLILIRGESIHNVCVAEKKHLLKNEDDDTITIVGRVIELQAKKHQT